MKQYLRKASLIVQQSDGMPGLDLSELQFRFSVKRGDIQTPNSADIRIYNLSKDTAVKIRREYSSIVLQCGYEDDANYGAIFTGTVSQVRRGRENAADSFLDITADDGDIAYNFSVLNTTLAAGSKQQDVVNAAAKSFAGNGVGQGYQEGFDGTSKPRSKVLFGKTRDVLRQAMYNAGCRWSIQDGNMVIVSETSFLPGQAIKLNSATGLIGFPQQTVGGIIVRSLLNSRIKPNTLLQINEADILKYRFPLDIQSLPGNSFVPSIAHDGFYKVIYAEHSGDTRGQEWYTDIVCLASDSSIVPTSLYPKLPGVATPGPVNQYRNQ